MSGCFGLSAWCGRLCAALTAAEAREIILNRIFKEDAETALLMVQSVTRLFMVEAFLKQKEITQDNLTLWSAITDWIFASPEWDHAGDHEHLDREFVSCAICVLFCAAPDFWPLVCVIDGRTFQSSRSVWNAESRNLAPTGLSISL